MHDLPEIADYPARLSFRFCPLCATPLEPRRMAGGTRLACTRDGWVHFPTPNLAATKDHIFSSFALFAPFAVR